MKKIKLLSLCIAIIWAGSVQAQSSITATANGKTTVLAGDTAKPAKKDTAYVPVYIIQRTDTVRARIVVVEKNGSLGVVRGFVFMTGMKNAQNQWLQQPAIYYMDAGYMPVRQEVLTAF